MIIVFATLHVRASAQAVPLAAGCLAAALPPDLRNRAQLLDFFPGEAPEAIAATLAALAPHLVCVPLYSWNRSVMTAVARRLRQALPEARLVAGGPEASADPAGVLAAGGFHAVVRGEGEATFAELVAALAAGAPLAPLAGLSIATDQGPVHGPERGSVDPASLPSPWLSGVLRATGDGGVLWETARGCPFACDYCYEGRAGGGTRSFPEARLVAELQHFARHGASQAWVLDSTFNFPPERGRRLLELARQHAPNLHLHLEAKAEFIDRPTARLLSRQPCSIQLGLQSFHPEVLRHIHRSLDPALFRERVQLLEAEGVTFGFDLIYGLPGDDYRGFASSLAAALELRPNHLDLFPLAVLPGTPLFERRAEFGLEADPQAPYLLRASATLTAADLQRCRLLAAATDLFYNLGRAVAFFPTLLKATATDAVTFLEAFAAWLGTERGLAETDLLTLDRWRPEEILEFQESFVATALRRHDRSDLLPAAGDLLRYHFHYAETLLGPEALPAPPETLRGRELWTTPWRTAPALRLVPFNYEVLDLQELAEPDLEEITRLFRPVGSVALFLRRGDEVLCESLEEEVLTLLRGCDGRRSPKEIFAGGVPRGEGEEIVEIAVAEGLLLPPEG